MLAGWEDDKQLQLRASNDSGVQLANLEQSPREALVSGLAGVLGAGSICAMHALARNECQTDSMNKASFEYAG